MSIKVLITGCKGQLGRDLQHCAAGYPDLELLCTDVDTLDLCQSPSVKNYINGHRPHFIINCAAYTAVDKAEEDEERAFALNAYVVEHLVAAASIVNAKLIHISTDYVFDGRNEHPYLESDPVNPQSVYGISKLAGEKAALSYAHSMVVRTAWLYTADGNNFVNTMLRLGAERKDINVVSDQVGSPTYAADLADALLRIIMKTANKETDFVPGVYHYTNEGHCSWYEFAQRIMELGHRHCTTHPISTDQYPTAARRPAYSILSKEKIKSTYGIEIPAWDDALQRCFQQKSL